MAITAKRTTTLTLMMLTSLPANFAAILAIVPVALYALKRGGARDWLFWLLMAVAVMGPFVLVIGHIAAAGWQVGFGFSLWVTVSASMGVFAILSVLEPNSHRLTPLVAIYMVLLGLLAMIWSQFDTQAGLKGPATMIWIQLHIAVSVATYALVTLAAVAALAGFLQERALKSKKRTALNRLLPSVADSDILVFKLLGLGEVVLGIGLVTGIATHYAEMGTFIDFDHKTILTFSAFIIIALILILHRSSGLRGRTVTRLVLFAYLLMTLGYPGVKFVTERLVGVT